MRLRDTICDDARAPILEAGVSDQPQRGNVVTVREKEVTDLAIAYEQARAFLALDTRQKAESDWFRSIRDDRDARTFFSSTPLTKSTGFAVHVATLVAQAYVGCVESGEDELAPTGTEVRDLKVRARELEKELEAAGSWLIQEARTREFREPLRKLGEYPSRLVPRTAGRRPLLGRRTFVLTLAESLYELTSTFPTKFLMATAVRAWEETSDRQIREVLTDDQRSSVVAVVHARRNASLASENATIRLINRVSIAQPRPEGPSADSRSDAEKVSDALNLLKSLADPTTSMTMTDALSALAREFGLDARDSI